MQVLLSTLPCSLCCPSTFHLRRQELLQHKMEVPHCIPNSHPHWCLWESAHAGDAAYAAMQPDLHLRTPPALFRHTSFAFTGRRDSELTQQLWCMPYTCASFSMTWLQGSTRPCSALVCVRGTGSKLGWMMLYPCLIRLQLDANVAQDLEAGEKFYERLLYCDYLAADRPILGRLRL